MLIQLPLSDRWFWTAGSRIDSAPNSSVLEFLDVLLYYVKGHSGPIWRMPPGRVEETRILDQDIRFGYWRVLEKGICFINQAVTPPEIDFFDFATHQLKQIAIVDKAKGFALGPGFAVSPDGRQVLFARIDQVDSDIMLVENFR